MNWTTFIFNDLLRPIPTNMEGPRIFKKNVITLVVCIMHEVSNSLSEEESRKENKNSERINAKPSKAVFALPHF